MRKLLTIIFLLPLMAGATVYNWNTSTSVISIDNTTFGSALTRGDTVLVDFRIGGYDVMNITGLFSGARYTYITIRFINGAYLKAQTGSSGNNHATSCAGIRFVGIHMEQSPEDFLAFMGFDVRWPVDIVFEDCEFEGSTPFRFDFTGAPYFLGDTARMVHDWIIRRCIFDSTYNMNGDRAAVQFGDPFARSGRTYFRDILIEDCEFSYYPSPVDYGAGPGGSDIVHPSNFIKGDNVHNIVIRRNKFHDLGVVPNPGGHTSSINLSLSKMEIYQNTFGPNNFGDDIRMTGSDLIGFAAYSGLSRVYCNVTYYKRKYGFIEARYADDGAPGVVPDTLATYVRDRTGPEVWFITGYRMGTGAGGNAFYSGAASLYDFYRTDTIHLHNSVVMVIIDTTCDLSYFRTVDFALSGPYLRVDTANNRRSCDYSAFPIDTTAGTHQWEPVAGSALIDQGEDAPAYITTDFHGNPRTVGTKPDIGAVEKQPANNPSLQQVIKFVRVVPLY